MVEAHIRKIKGNRSWTFLYPLGEVYLTPAVGREYMIDRVRLVDKDKLPRIWKKAGLNARVSELKKRGQVERFFDNDKTTAFAIVHQGGEGSDVEQRCKDLIREELAILAVSQLGYARRKQMGPVLAPGEITNAHTSFLALDKGSSAHYHNWFKLTAPLNQTVMGGGWKRFQDNIFFTDLLKILRGDTKVDKGWREELRRVSVLVGESIGANDPLKSFLWNMIALEMLLTKDDKGMKELLPRRMAALLDWNPEWRSMDYPTLIQDAYDKRNSLLHQGRREEITEWDLEFTDHILLHALGNLVRSSKLFPSKGAFIEFTKRLEAERTLGQKPKVQREGSFMFMPKLKAKPPADRGRGGMARTEIRLLRALVNEAMGRTGDVDRAVGPPVVVSGAAAAEAGIAPNRHYEEVVSACLARLVDEGALVPDAEATDLLANVMGVDEAYQITRRGIDMLREEGEL